MRWYKDNEEALLRKEWINRNPSIYRKAYKTTFSYNIRQFNKKLKTLWKEILKSIKEDIWRIKQLFRG